MDPGTGRKGKRRRLHTPRLIKVLAHQFGWRLFLEEGGGEKEGRVQKACPGAFIRSYFDGDGGVVARLHEGGGGRGKKRKWR